MSFSLADFSAKRNYLYHSTSRSNLASIRRFRELRAARLWLEELPGQSSGDTRRPEHRQLRELGVTLQSQWPLHEKNIQWEDGYNLPHFLRDLNSFVFFWPGTDKGPDPNGSGVPHFASPHGPGDAVILRVASKNIMDKNPKFSRFNSGSPRWSGGMKSPRGPKTFLDHKQFEGTLCQVIEVAFKDSVRLPEDAQVAENPSGPWRSLYNLT